MSDIDIRLDEEFDTQMEVERDPCGAWQAIQTLSAALDAAEAEIRSSAGSHQKALAQKNNHIVQLMAAIDAAEADKRQAVMDERGVAVYRPGYELACEVARESGIFLPPFESVKITVSDV